MNRLKSFLGNGKCLIKKKNRTFELDCKKVFLALDRFSGLLRNLHPYSTERNNIVLDFYNQIQVLIEYD